MTKSGYTSSIKESDLGEGKMRGVRIKGKPVLLAKVKGQVYALSNRCPHAGCELQGGILSDFVVMCPCHGWKFDVQNGQYLENSLTSLDSYPCKVENGKIQVQIQR